jgi:hypothetical protein
MENTWRYAGLFLLLAVVGCGEKLELALPPNAPVKVVELSGSGQPKEWLLQPSSNAYQQLQRWIAQNQNGWSKYLITTPGTGILVSVGDIRLQFVGTLVLACPTRAPCFSKTIRESEYAFLVQP